MNEPCSQDEKLAITLGADQVRNHQRGIARYDTIFLSAKLSVT